VGEHERTVRLHRLHRLGVIHRWLGKGWGNVGDGW
jgi:hypothetical protein